MATLAETQQVLSDAVKQADDATASLRATVEDLKAKVIDMENRFAADGATQQMADDLTSLRDKLNSLLKGLPPPPIGPGGSLTAQVTGVRLS